MNQAFTAYQKQKGSRRSPVVEDAKQRHADECQFRLAKIHNGAHPDYQDGHPKDEEKRGRKIS